MLTSMLSRHPRFHVYFTPASSSWLNMVERFFRDLTQNRLRRGIFRDVEELITAISDYKRQARRPVTLCYKCVLTYYERNLPHWQPEDAAVFITWRLHGSFPRTVEISQNQSAGKSFAAMARELDRAAAGPPMAPR
jgi:hypothetical protein